MDLEVICWVEYIRQRKMMPYDFTFMWNVKKKLNGCTWQKQTHRCRELFFFCLLLQNQRFNSFGLIQGNHLQYFLQEGSSFFFEAHILQFLITKFVHKVPKYSTQYTMGAIWVLIKWGLKSFLLLSLLDNIESFCFDSTTATI